MKSSKLTGESKKGKSGKGGKGKGDKGNEAASCKRGEGKGNTGCNKTRSKGGKGGKSKGEKTPQRRFVLVQDTRVTRPRPAGAPSSRPKQIYNMFGTGLPAAPAGGGNAAGLKPQAKSSVP